MNIIQTPSQNYGSHDGLTKELITKPILIVIHWMASIFSSGVAWLTNPSSKVSAHICMNYTGAIIKQLVQFNRRAWHCGGSWHPLFPDSNAGYCDSNFWTIGIEIDGPPSVIGQQGWSPLLIPALTDLIGFIKDQNPEIMGILDHSTIDPLHKQDVKVGTGINLFSWNEMMDILAVKGLADFTVEPYASEIRKHFAS